MTNMTLNAGEPIASAHAHSRTHTCHPRTGFLHQIHHHNAARFTPTERQA